MSNENPVIRRPIRITRAHHTDLVCAAMNDTTGASQKILDRMTEDARRQAMAAEARRLGNERTFDRHVLGLIEVFQKVAAGRNSHGPHRANAGSSPHTARAGNRKRAAR